MTFGLTAVALAWLLLVLATVAWAAIQSRAGHSLPLLSVHPALLIRPCAGDEPNLARTLRSTALARHSFSCAVRFAIAAPHDTARPSADEATRVLVAHGLDARVVISFAEGPNRKADQLARVLAAEERPHRVVIVSDSDVDLEAISLDALVAPLSHPGVGASWAAPVEVSPQTLADHASAAVLDSSLHSFPLLAALDPRGMVGKLFAVRVDALDEVGGFAGLTRVLGEDFELARKLRLRGWRVVRSNVLAPSLVQGRSIATVVGRYARWLAVIRAQRPLLLPTYPLLFFPTAPLIAVSLVASWREGPAALSLAAIALAARLGLALLARARTGRPASVRTVLGAAVLADGLLCLAFCRALVGRRVRWRGVTLHLGTRGVLSHDRARGEPTSRSRSR